MRRLGGKRKPYSKGFGMYDETEGKEDWLTENVSEFNTTELSPTLVEPTPTLLQTMMPVGLTDYSRVDEVATRIDDPNIVSRAEKMADDMLSNQVSIIKSQLESVGLDQALNDMGLSVKFEDLTYDRAKTALAVFGLYKLLQNRKTAPAVLIAAAGYLYLFMTKNKRVEAKIASVTNASVDSSNMGSLSRVARKFSRGF